MCFSASASFGSAILLSIIGVGCVANTKKKSQVMFASIPFFFAVQQLTEGFIWLSVKTDNDDIYRTMLLHFYLIFAYVLWPSFVPASIYLLEKNPVKIKLLRFISIAGIMLSVSYTFFLIRFPVTMESGIYHIKYIMDFPASFMTFASIAYGISTVLPQFISSVKRMKWMGMLIIFSYTITLIFYKEYIISVWCYFSALVSVVIYFILDKLHHSDE